MSFRDPEKELKRIKRRLDRMFLFGTPKEMLEESVQREYNEYFRNNPDFDLSALSSGYWKKKQQKLNLISTLSLNMPPGSLFPLNPAQEADTIVTRSISQTTEPLLRCFNFTQKHREVY